MGRQMYLRDLLWEVGYLARLLSSKPDAMAMWRSGLDKIGHRNQHHVLFCFAFER